MTGMIACPQCGETISRAAVFCSHCGIATPTGETVQIDGDSRGLENTTVEQLEAELRVALAPNISVVRRLGQGGMGVVFLGRDAILRRLVVIKVLSPALAHDPVARIRFEREAQAAATVSHPNIVSVYHVGKLTRSETSYFVMEFVEGATLGEEFPEGTVASEPQAKRIMTELASALAAAHSRGVVHRDIKPSNVMIEAETGRTVVLDFGISAALAGEKDSVMEELTEEGAIIGTPAYMSPEQALGGWITDLSDVYSLGCVVFRLVTGEPPFPGDTPMALAVSHIHDAPPKVGTVREDLDPTFTEIIDQCLAKSEEERPSAGSIFRMLSGNVGHTIEWPPPGLDRLVGAGMRLMWTAVGLLAIALISVFTLLALDASHLLLNLNISVVSLPALWQIGASGVGLLLSAILVALFTYQGLRLARDLKRAGRLGYPWLSILDCLSAAEDTGAILNGTGKFALVSPLRRESFLLLRRLALLLGLLWTLIGGLALLGLSGLLEDWGNLSAPSIGATKAAWLSLAVVLSILPIWLPILPESKLRAARKARGKASASSPEEARDLVRGWLGSAGFESPRGQLPQRLTVGVPLVVALVLIGGIAAIGGSVKSASTAHWMRADLERLAALEELSFELIGTYLPVNDLSAAYRVALGVTVATGADSLGWRATSTHSRSGKWCRISHGSGSMIIQGQEPDVVICEAKGGTYLGPDGRLVN